MRDFLPKDGNFEEFCAHLASLGVVCRLHRRPIKRTYLRFRGDTLRIHAPIDVDTDWLAQELRKQAAWIQKAHQKHQNRPVVADTLWGEPYVFANPAEKLARYKAELNAKLPALQQKWQPIVGKSPSTVRIKKMYTRFGSCNSATKRVWLSAYLPALDYRCVEYVFVHELCHLHHANHGPQFWQKVEESMPDWKRWDALLKTVNLRLVAGNV